MSVHIHSITAPQHTSDITTRVDYADECVNESTTGCAGPRRPPTRVSPSAPVVGSGNFLLPRNNTRGHETTARLTLGVVAEAVALLPRNGRTTQCLLPNSPVAVAANAGSGRQLFGVGA